MSGIHIKSGPQYYHSTNFEEDAVIHYRYAEVLLNFAEAKAELGTITQSDLDNSIGLLGARIGMPDIILGMNLIEFTKQFQSDADCISYLMDIKWKDGVKCKKCSSDEFWKGKYSNNVRCKQCGYEESPTAGTLFHKIKFPLLKAFHMCYRVSVSKKGMSSWELSRELSLRQMTCWAFKRKIQETMASSGLNPLEKRVDVDEMAI